jgi:predicted DNA-binding protein YlxM (UPF0122 family)
MRTSSKIRGVIATADLTMTEVADLCGLTRQTLHAYLNDPDVDLEEFNGGIKLMDVCKKMMELCVSDVLPLDRKLDKDGRMETLKALVLS